MAEYTFARPTDISIHAPLRERQWAYILKAPRQAYFNPRSLTGATLAPMPPAADY